LVTLTAVLIVLSLAYAFVNGRNDSPSIVAPAVSTHAFRPRQALLVAALAQAAGPLLLGTAVATTVVTRVVRADMLRPQSILAALLAALLWAGLTSILGIPSSSSHALIGGLAGAALATAGPSALQPSGLGRVGLGLLISPPLGLLFGYLIVWLTYRLARRAKPALNTHLRRWQRLLMLGLGVSHGASDAPKAMGILTLGLIVLGLEVGPRVPIWVAAACVGSFCLGTSIGGWRQMKTLGARFYRLRPVHGFGALVAGSLVVLSSATMGGPISTTQVMASAILGAGAAERLNKVRWLILRDMLTAWLLTIPITLVLAAGLVRLLQLLRIG
jgi:inorganic phosphate transporter, PiT family